MSFKIVPTPPFERELKHLAKKHLSIKKDITRLIEELDQKPLLGTSLGNSCYKIRLAIASKGRGKSGGARIITYVQVVDETIFLLAIYDKSEIENLTDKDIQARLKLIQ